MAAATLQAFALAATDYATKPTSGDGLATAKEQVRRELIRKITGLHAPVITLPPSVLKPVPALRPIQRRIDIVAIGTSTGGPNALGEVIPALPEDLAVPVVVVQQCLPFLPAC